jgi:hypothetical protein
LWIGVRSHLSFVLVLKKTPDWKWKVRLDLVVVGHTQQLNAIQAGEAEHLAEELARRRAGSSVARARGLAAWQARAVEAALATAQTEFAANSKRVAEKDAQLAMLWRVMADTEHRAHRTTRTPTRCC